MHFTDREEMWKVHLLGYAAAINKPVHRWKSYGHGDAISQIRPQYVEYPIFFDVL